MNPILIVDDNEQIVQILAQYVKAEGWPCLTARSGEEALSLFDAAAPSLILLDIMLPGEDGIQILKELREGEVTKDIPVIMVTAKGAEFDKVQALDLGADDYVTKPFGMMELISRIRAVLRRTKAKNQTAAEEVLSIGPIRLDSARHEVTTDGKPVQLTLKEYELLRKMMENEGVVLTRDQLLVDIWGYDFDGETRTVDVHIRTLRTKLGDAGDLIETVRGVGYRIK